MMGRGFVYDYGTYDCGGIIPMILVVFVLGLLVLLFVKRSRKHREHDSFQSMSILNDRLAKGEIAPKEYEKLKKIIKK